MKKHVVVLMRVAVGLLLTSFSTKIARAAEIKVDLSSYRAGSSVSVRQTGTKLRATWPIGKSEFGVLVLDLKANTPLIIELSIASWPGASATPILQNVNPLTVLTVGTRDLKNPAGWVAFFDNVPKRPYQSYRAELDKKSARVLSEANRCTIIIEELSAGPFRGDMRFTLYPGTRLVHAQAVVSTEQDAAAILYDAGLCGATPTWQNIAYLDNHDQWQRTTKGTDTATPVAVRNRAIIAESAGGSVAVFPPPHQYFYPLDSADNFKFAWHGRDFHNMVKEAGFGIRQPPEGDKRWVPWVNAPPRTQQKLGLFYLLSRGKAATAQEEVRRFTRGDRFKKLDGYHTFNSHFHMEHTLDFLASQKAQNTSGVPRGLEEPGFVKTFKAHGVDIVHLAEFHIGWTPELTANRLSMLKSLHAECTRLSTNNFLLLPGEEPNAHLGGHWISFFPKPVYWTLGRSPQQPFSEQVAGYGTVYHVGNMADVLRLMEIEKGLMWTAHPRIKGSMGFPDAYRTTDFFLSDRFLGGAWKAMPADLSKPQLGTRVLDLQDDMANWGLRKYVFGEVDVFKVNPDYELYGPMNVNYLKLNRIPRFQDGWQSVLDALRNGQFFTTTGEILIPKFSVGGKQSGETLRLSSKAKTTLEASLEWTFPLSFAEIISGDGTNVFRQRIDLSDTNAFNTRVLKVPADLTKRRWVRFEVWDVAGNGAFAPPIWLESDAFKANALSVKPPSPLVAAPPVINTQPVTWARFVPEREDDFAWENDLVAFRTFGPALRNSTEDSGIDCWFKRVNYPIIDKWYTGGNYHEDHGEGYDGYQVGSSRGCGGNGIWKNGKLYISDVYKEWKIVSRTPEQSVFELTYDYNVDGTPIREVKRIAIEMGKRLFRSESTFTQDGKPIVLDIAIGVTTHGGKATATLNPQRGWMACWEKIDGSGLCTGVAIAPKQVVEMREVKSTNANEGHALLLTRTDNTGKVAWFSGYGWERAGTITTPEKWQAYLTEFAATLQ